tara:strand:- start:267 stop:1073 length:807 start_codon:yes stop_codon:yes gene_type:complete
VKHINIPSGYIKRNSSTIPFGYEKSNIVGYFKPIPNKLKVLYVGQEWFKTGASYGEVQIFLKENTNDTLSRVGLQKNFTKGNFVSNLYDVDINKLKRNCTICDRIYFISPIGTKVGGTGQRKYCTKRCTQTQRSRHKKVVYMLKNFNKKSKGFVYCITNPSFEGWVKVGKAVHVERRVSAYNVSSPYRNYKIKYFREFDNCSRAEYFLLNKLGSISDEQSGEWFKIDVDKTIDVIKNHEDVNITKENVATFMTPKTKFISNLQRVIYI